MSAHPVDRLSGKPEVRLEMRRSQWQSWAPLMTWLSIVPQTVYQEDSDGGDDATGHKNNH
jgi:hypothetical protein